MKTLIFLFLSAILFSLNLSAQTVAIEFKYGNSADRSIAIDRARRVPAALASTPRTASALDLEREAFALLNEKRRETGLAPLVWNDDVAEIARIHSQNMANENFFSHKGTDGTLVNDRADRQGLSNWRAIGENIAYTRGFNNPVETAVNNWMLSVKHKENLLSKEWKESAVGIAVKADGTVYFTQVFLLRK